jgi:hypothetical protein
VHANGFEGGVAGAVSAAAHGRMETLPQDPSLDFDYFIDVIIVIFCA